MVDSLVIAGIVFACTFGGAAFGMLLRGVLPESHLSNDSKDIMKMGTGLIATLAALVLGLLVASAKGTFDTQRAGFQQSARQFCLARPGPGTLRTGGQTPSRDLVRRTVSTLHDRLWPADNSRISGLDASEITVLGGELFNAVQDLKPQTDTQRTLPGPGSANRNRSGPNPLAPEPAGR